METVPPGLPPAGFFLSLLTESFAVRALLGSLLAVALAAAALRSGRATSPTARRLVVLAPVVAAMASAVASLAAAEAYLPQLWIASPGVPSGPALELLGELRVISNARGLDVLFLAWAVTAVVLLSRRAWGVAVTQRLLRSAVPVQPGSRLWRHAAPLYAAMGVRRADLRLLEGCPGGALAAGLGRPVVVMDPALLRTLDEHELEGLLAHEIAHVARRDSLLSLGVGVLRDLLFFLPPVHLVGRWLQHEREESADELASGHTKRPAALASGILKVFQTARPAVPTLQACGAVGSIALGGRRRQGVGLSAGAQVVATRVERLVTLPRGRSAARQVVEVSLAAVLIVAASAASLVVPRWIATELNAYSLAIGYIPPPAAAVESPAFATFRALAPFGGATGLHGYERTLAPPGVTGGERVGACPCVESQAQWLAGVPATRPVAPATMAWRRTANPTWAVDPGPGSVRARSLFTLREAGPQVGFFVVAESGS